MRQIQQSYIHRDAAPRQSFPDHLRHLARSCRNFQQGKSFDPAAWATRSTIFCVVATPPNQLLTRPMNGEHSLRFARRASVRIENLRCVDSLHRNRLILLDDEKFAEAKPLPALLPATACYTGRCSSRSRRAVRRACPVPRFVPFVQHGDAVGIAHRGDAMRDENCGAALHDFAQVIQNFVFGVSVDAGERVIQNQDARIANQSASDRGALLLSAREA